MRRCGGCEGQGAHWRWCPEKVGHRASIIGIAADRAEDLGDTVGSNFPEGSNALYRASGVLRREANDAAMRHIAQNLEWDGEGDSRSS